MDFKKVTVGFFAAVMAMTSVCFADPETPVTTDVPATDCLLYTSFSQFEITTAIAFLYFAEENCDIVVLETGLGGLLDLSLIHILRTERPR